MSNRVTPAQALEMLWRRGSLVFLLDENQKALYEMFHNNPSKIQTWLLSRRSGKSYSLCVLAIEYCLKHPRSIIKYVAPSKMQVERFIRPLITDILARGCPDDIKPEYKKHDSIYFFSNGSEIQLCAAEAGNIDSVRGGFSHIAIVDEAQDVSNLRYAVNSVLLPTTLTTKGKVLLSGTPPQDLDHEFLDFIEMAGLNNTLVVRTIYDNPRLTKEDIQLQIEAMGGEHSEDFQREYLCKILKSSSRSVIPEFDDIKEKELVKTWERPVFYHPYVSCDMGFRDMTVVLFAYYDFVSNKLIIEDEIVMHGDKMHIRTLAHAIEAKEKELWTNPVTNEYIKPKKRVADHDLIFINEIKKETGYRILFDPADKKDMLAGINFLRSMVNDNRIIINPKCKVTIYHFKNARWTDTGNKEKLAHGADGSHYDAIPAASYLCRAIDFKANPFPRNYESKLRSEDVFYTPQYRENTVVNADVYRSILGTKPNWKR